MSCQQFCEIKELQKHQLAVNLASLILHDGKQDFNSENLKKVLKASGINVPEYWPDLVCRALEGKNLGDFLQVSGGGSSAPVGDNKAQSGAKEEKKAEEKPKTEEEEEDVDMGGFFD